MSATRSYSEQAFYIHFIYFACFKEYIDISGHNRVFMAILKFLQYFDTTDNDLEDEGVEREVALASLGFFLLIFCNYLALEIPYFPSQGCTRPPLGPLLQHIAFFPLLRILFLPSPTLSSWQSGIPSSGFIQGFSPLEELFCLPAYNEVSLLWTPILLILYGNPPIYPASVRF